MKKSLSGTNRCNMRGQREKRRLLKYTAMICTAALLSTVTGCGKKAEEVSVTPTPAATATPVPVTSTPIPTPTQAVKMIGTKTKDAKMVYLTNGTKEELRGIYLKGTEEEEWGRNLIPAESSVKAQEQVRMYYGPLSSEEESSYDMKLTTETGNTYTLTELSLEDMERASLKLDEENDILSLRYMSLSQKKEVTISNGDSDDSQEEDWEEESQEENEDSSYWEPEENTGDYEDGSDNSDTEDGTDSNGGSGDYEENGGADSQDGGSDDGSTDEQGNDGSGEDGSHTEDGSGDGSEDGSGDIIWDENGNWIEG